MNRWSTLVILATLSACAPSAPPMANYGPTYDPRKPGPSYEPRIQTLAAGERMCRSLASMAEETARARDRGVPRWRAISAVTEPHGPTRQVLLESIHAVYDAPVLGPSMIRSATYSGCMQAVVRPR
jgi:hypothetical protein